MGRIMTVRRLKVVYTGIGVLVAGWAAADMAPKFTQRPMATKTADGAKIEFAVERETDVAVYVEDAHGTIVRHLVAGALGTNAPAPLKANSLVQSLLWDGKDDDGNGVPGEGLKVRVGLGLKASYAGQAFAEKGQTGPNRIESIRSLAVGADGRLYVLNACNALVWGGTRLSVFGRDGAYEQTLQPFPVNVTPEKARPAGAFVNSLGSLNPLIYRPSGFAFYPAENSGPLAVTPDGRVLLGVDSTRIAMLDRDGGIADTAYAGPALGAGLKFMKSVFQAVAADSKAVYLTGLGPGKPAPAIYHVTLSARGPAEVWFGDPATAGSDDTHLSNPQGVAVDGQGHLLVADAGNNRVLVINEQDKRVAGSLAVPNLEWLGVHPRSGALYVRSGDSVVKFASTAGWQNLKEQARLELPKLTEKGTSWKLALDGVAEPAILWAGAGTRLERYEDQGAAFSAATAADCLPARLFHRPAADPTRREVACKWMVAPYSATVNVLTEATGEIRTIPGATGKGGIAGIEGREHRLGPDGSIYAQDHAGQAGGIIRFDREGKPKPFEATLHDPFLKGRLPVGPTGTTNWERDFYVDRKGDIYVRAAGPEYHGLMTVHVYDQQGNLKRIVVHGVSDAMYGPRVDPQGNLYIVDSVKPTGGQLFPAEFTAPLAGKPGLRDWYDWIYGSVIKFGPEGGAIWYSGKHASPLTYEGWGAMASISDLRTTGGSLVGTVSKAPGNLIFPSVRVATGSNANTRIVFRMKNDTPGTQAILSYHHLNEGYIESCGSGFKKTIDIKPNSDFTEYAFDMAGEQDWKGVLWHLGLIPTTGAGSFSIDWVRIGDGDPKLAWNFDAEDGPDKKLPAGLAKETVGAWNRPGGAVLQGAKWWKFGFAPIGEVIGNDLCHCTASDFDVDDFGRVFAPDTARFRVSVLDTAGNEILSIGAYGNQDCCGPDSYVFDPVAKRMRPRREGDARDLASPSAKPDIAFAWIIGLAVTDRNAYVDDVVNKRILRVKLDYAASDTCEVK